MNFREGDRHLNQLERNSVPYFDWNVMYKLDSKIDVRYRCDLRLRMSARRNVLLFRMLYMSIGLPKSVMIIHGNIVATSDAVMIVIPNLGTNDVYVAYLPLAHVFQFATEILMMAGGASIGYSSALILASLYLFFCLKSELFFDGHLYLSEDDKRGVVVVVASKEIDIEETLGCKALVIVEDTNVVLVVLNDVMEDRYSVLITLVNQFDADGFYCSYNETAEWNLYNAQLATSKLLHSVKSKQTELFFVEAKFEANISWCGLSAGYLRAQAEKCVGEAIPDLCLLECCGAESTDEVLCIDQESPVLSNFKE
nr:long-chain acyl-CoA synthetase 8 [Ipomoea batatas]